MKLWPVSAFMYAKLTALPWIEYLYIAFSKAKFFFIVYFLGQVFSCSSILSKRSLGSGREAHSSGMSFGNGEAGLFANFTSVGV